MSREQIRLELVKLIVAAEAVAGPETYHSVAEARAAAAREYDALRRRVDALEAIVTDRGAAEEPPAAR